MIPNKEGEEDAQLYWLLVVMVVEMVVRAWEANVKAKRIYKNVQKGQTK
jgi:hypothetical protein